MKELIKITTNEQGQQLVSARELYLGLGLNKSNWAKWFNKNILNNEFFKEHEDWEGFVFSTNGNETTDFAISIDFAKHIAMMARTEKSHEFRNYFIECEKKLREVSTPQLPQDYLSALKALVASEEEKAKLLQEKKENAPKVLFADSVSTSKTTILVREMAKILKQNGVDTGEKKFYKWLRENGYLVKASCTDYNMPTQKSMRLGLFEIKETTINHSNGTISISRTPKVTGKGQQYFINKFLNK